MDFAVRKQIFKRDRSGVKGKQNHWLINIILQNKDEKEKSAAIAELRRRIHRSDRYINLNSLSKDIRDKINKTKAKRRRNR